MQDLRANPFTTVFLFFAPEFGEGRNETTRHFTDAITGIISYIWYQTRVAVIGSRTDIKLGHPFQSGSPHPFKNGRLIFSFFQGFSEREEKKLMANGIGLFSWSVHAHTDNSSNKRWHGKRHIFVPLFSPSKRQIIRPGFCFNEKIRTWKIARGKQTKRKLRGVLYKEMTNYDILTWHKFLHPMAITYH